MQAYATPTDVLGSACTGPDGTYTIGVPMGTYRIRVYDLSQRFASQWAYAADTYDTADPIAASAGLGSVVNVALLSAGAIAGTVTDAVTGSPLNACWKSSPSAPTASRRMPAPTTSGATAPW